MKIPPSIGIPAIIFLGGKIYLHEFVPSEKIAEGYYNHLWQTCPLGETPGVPHHYVNTIMLSFFVCI